VQPYLEGDETALMYLAGEYSHAIRKGPMLGRPPDASGLYRAEEISAVRPSPHEREVADRLMAWATERFGELLYARIDLLDGAVLELELAEPSLFSPTRRGPPSASRRRSSETVDGVILVDKPAGATSTMSWPACGARSPGGASATRARWTPSPRGC